MATGPQFVAVPKMGVNLAACRSATANANRDGTGTINYILVGGANGTRVDRVIIKANVTTTAGMIRFFIKDTAGTPNILLIYEVPVPVITASATVAAFYYEWSRVDGFPITVLPSGWSLGWAPNNAESFDVVPILAGDF